MCLQQAFGLIARFALSFMSPIILSLSKEGLRRSPPPFVLRGCRQNEVPPGSWVSRDRPAGLVRAISLVVALLNSFLTTENTESTEMKFN